MLHIPFYDPEKSYDDNYAQGPFGGFADGKKVITEGEPTYDFYGHKVYAPLGIPAGPILNSNFVKGAFEKGFDVVVYKTVRSGTFPCHPWPNVLSVKVDGDLTPEKMKSALIADTNYHEPLSITNSFGVPSKEAAVWQEDVKKALSYTGKGQVLVLSFMGTVKPNQTQQELIDDFALAAKLSKETGAPILEVNLSCPNIGNEGLVCYNVPVTEQVLKAIRETIGDTPLIVKVGYFDNNDSLQKIAAAVQKYANGISAINTLQAEVRNDKGEQALPGSPLRLRSGVCGATIKWAGVEMVKRLAQIKKENNYTFSIEGVGGVTVPEDYTEYVETGADSVMSATGAMWNPYLAQEIKEKILKLKVSIQ